MRKYIYTLKSDLLEKVITNYIDYVTNPYHIWRQFINPSVWGEPEYNNGEGIKPMPLSTKNNLKEGKEEEIMSLPCPRYENAKADVMAMVDILYRCSLNCENESGYFTVSSKYLKTASNNYVYIIRTLNKMLIMNINHYVSEGQYDRTLYLIRDESMFHPQLISSISRTSANAIKKVDDYADKIHKEKLQKVIEMTSETFVERYNKALSKLRIDKETAQSYVNSTYIDDGDILSRKSRLRTIHKLTNEDYIKEIRSIDDNGRIYHIGTELQRDLKQFTNIEYTIDCKNSHPFLLSYLLFRYHVTGSIDVDERFDDELHHSLLREVMLYLRENSGIYNHYTFSDFVCKSLENKYLSKQQLAKTKEMLKSVETVPADVWKYISDVSEGKIWDMFVEAFGEDRTIVKQKVFASVMYSYASARNKSPKEENAKWVEMFSRLYPTVYMVINEIKKSLHQQCKEKGRTTELKHPHTVEVGKFMVTYTQKDDILLPLLLMRLESRIFTKILTKLFNKRILCFGIHDAVAVLKSKLSEEEIKQVMMSVYEEYGLIPTLSIDHYHT